MHTPNELILQFKKTITTFNEEFRNIDQCWI